MKTIVKGSGDITGRTPIQKSILRNNLKAMDQKHIIAKKMKSPIVREGLNK